MSPIGQFKSVYLIGIGGIGMSALARYFISRGLPVGGFDKTPSELVRCLQEEGAQVHFQESVSLIPEVFLSPETTLVIYTPAISREHQELRYFFDNGFQVLKRAEVLGLLTRSSKGLCVAGTHGKTTTSTMIAHILSESHVQCNAFLGGISKNVGSNLILSTQSPYSVIEADEYDRSFHQLRPFISVITATDADHLDIYGTYEAYLESFQHYTSLIAPEGCLIVHTGLDLVPKVQDGVSIFTYSKDEGDFRAGNIRIGKGRIVFDFIHPEGTIKDIELGVPVLVNIENGIAAMAVARMAGASDEEIRSAMLSFQGVERRFDFLSRDEHSALLLDYAHHPMEIRSSAQSLRALYPTERLTAIFQPHLYTRTRDFYKDFASSLSLFDEVLLTEIYPAREQPIEGVTSQLILDNMDATVSRHLCLKKDVTEVVRSQATGSVIVLLGAGDIDRMAEEILNAFKQKRNE